MQTRPQAGPLDNPAAVLHGVHDLRFEDIGIAAEVPAGCVRVAMKNVGICRSDVHYLERGRIGNYVVKGPMVIGHESAGIVVAAGEGVTNLAAGDRVALEPGVPCWQHHHSREGRYNLDPDIRFFATPPHHGSLAKYVDHPADFCFKLPDAVSLEEGAMCEPLSVGIHACRRAGVTPGKKVAILGAGPIGLVALLSAKAFGADAIAITDLREENLELASRLGATACLRARMDELPEAVAVRLQEALPPYGPEIVIDCAGFESTMQTALEACHAGGRVVLVGMGQEEMRLPMVKAAIKEVDVMGSFRYANTVGYQEKYPLCISLLESKRIDVRPMITHRFGFSAADIAAGFDTAARSAETNAVKVMFGLD